MAGTFSPLTVFISGATKEFSDDREKLRQLLEQRGAIVEMQESFPNDVNRGRAIQKCIDNADVTICLIGHHYGMALPPNNRPDDAVPGCSWTQWEYLHAIEVFRRDPGKRLIVFMDKRPPRDVGPSDTRPDEHTLSQQAFRDRYYLETERPSFDGLFFENYTGTEKLLEAFKTALENRSGRDDEGVLRGIRYSYWLGVKAAYRKKSRDAWIGSYPRSFTARTGKAQREMQMAAPKAPFIETQSFSILRPDNEMRQCRFLSPAAFLTGRDTNQEISASNNAVWHPLTEPGGRKTTGKNQSDRRKLLAALTQPTGEPVILGGIALPDPIRLYLVSGSGVGKSTNMRWLEAALNGLDDDRPDAYRPTTRLGVLMDAAKWFGVTRQNLNARIADKILADVPSEEAWHKECINVGLRKDLLEANIVFLIDGLDHLPEDLTFLRDVQSNGAREENWASWPIVAAGRPHALRAWEDHPDPLKTIVASNWRFLQPAEFTSEQAEIYLGRSEALSRFYAVEEHLRGLINVPRILEYVRKLDQAELLKVRTSSDIYEKSVLHLVKETLREGGVPARKLGPEWELAEKYVERGTEPSQVTVDHVMKLLSALAFSSLCLTVDPALPEPRDPHGQWPISLDQKRDLIRRLGMIGNTETDRAKEKEPIETLDRDLTALATFATVIGNGIIEGQELTDRTRPLNRVIWHNRTVQQFLAAFWLARHADGLDELNRLLNGDKWTPRNEARYDALRMRNYLFFPEADFTEDIRGVSGTPAIEITDTTYEFNIFLAEMPWSVITPSSWITSASAWYDPDLFTGAAQSSRVWASQMLYRSWTRMLHCAGWPLHDWWDVPYDTLINQPDKTPLEKASRSRDPDAPQIGKSTAEARTAQRVLIRFLSDFERRMARHEGSDDFVRNHHWIQVPPQADEATFRMGIRKPTKHNHVVQGCPTGKVEAYWHKLLSQVQTGRRTARDAAEYATRPEWFADNVSLLVHATDVAWLEELFKPLGEEHPDRACRQADPSSSAWRKAIDQIHMRFHTQDETPAENPQSVRQFEMHELPVTRAWFSLFAPGHRTSVEHYLAELENPHRLDPPAADASARSNRAAPRKPREAKAPGVDPHAAHPVIYASWFDAWAFCQWATWRDMETGKRYGLRLPHEPEWEYAARWTRAADGTPKMIPREQRWWWSDEFYTNENDPTEEPLSNPHAHAVGRPGQTRDPLEAKPNGLGFRDILGNVWEWTATLYDHRKEKESMRAPPNSIRYSRFEPRNRPPTNGQRTMRGGLWYYLNILATCANRFRYVCDDRDFRIGFRVVREERPEFPGTPPSQ